ncbi:hypothetical protein EHV15_19905 [Paenibacillus oralis]|uniref:VCBS repeat-containing protein n=1 Tax=Paenibacillus oralis TaxID=2490856 RepID=A0A3P3U5S0_9BACL|nr:hypothetical protein [Paenibacillus oralis]RRJ64929.1 hypothetical protein EHV15_19905 [Paenibacillus oralis]
MKDKILVIGVIFLLLSAAFGNVADPGQASGAQDSPASPQISNMASASATFEDAAEGGLLPLSWKKYDGSEKVRVLEDGLKQTERIVKEKALRRGDGSRENKIVIYTRKNDTDFLYTALVQDHLVYDLGKAAGYHYDQDDAVTVGNIMLFGKKVVKIQGAVGAAASMTHYIKLQDGEPVQLMVIDEGYASEMDVDHDGLPEVIVSSGTIPHTSVYRWQDGHIERSNLNEALRAEAVSITEEGAVLAAFGKDQSLVKLYWLKKDGLQEFSQYASDEYYSDRFVTIPYTSEEVQHIREQADGAGVFDPYVPRKGVATDYGMTAEQEKAGVLKLTYPHFAVWQSSTDLRQREEGNGASGEKWYFPDFTAEWIGLPDSEAGGTWYITRGSTHISISTAKSVSKEQLLFAAASLVPLDELKLSDGQYE